MVRFNSDDDDKGGIPNLLLFQIALTVLILPVTGFLSGVDILSVCFSGILGAGVFALLLTRPRRGSSFPWKIALAALSAEGMAILVMSNLMGSGPLALGGIALKSIVNPATSLSEFAENVQTMSVILPCANEGVYAIKTARSIGERTPKDVLKEIIVVDDGSTPPLEQVFHEQGQDVLDKYPVKFIRHETFTGLINAKKQGGDKATGDVLTFLDCHVLPRDYGNERTWADGIMTRVAGNYKRIVVPSITDLDAEKWEEIGRPKGVAKCYLSMDVDFRWFDSEDDFVPIMSGGLLAMSRRWWVETGGYDTAMIGWGGENIDQSLRAWLCGGEIVQATDSHVAHMWRTNDKPDTKAKYIVPEGSVNTNRYRAALAWFGEYIEKVKEFAIFSKFKEPTSAPLPNIDSILAVKDQLQCKNLQWFFNRFKTIYFDAGVLADQTFRIRDEHSNLCLARRNTGKREEHDVVAASCSSEDAMQLWHRANRNGDVCCSGLRSYDSMYCLSGGGSGEVSATECNTYGRNNQQHAKISNGEVNFTTSQSCLAVAASPKDVVVQKPCDTHGVLTRFKQVALSDASGLYNIVEESTGMCLTAYSPIGGNNDVGSLELVECSAHSIAQKFSIKESFLADFVEIRTWENLCLDAADGKRVLAYPCYDHQAKNHLQVFQFDAISRTVKNKFHPTCIAVPNGKVDSSATSVPLAVTGCVTWEGITKAEQKFEKIKSLRGIDGAFLVKSSTDWCIAGEDGKDVVLVVKCPKTKEEETDSMLWHFESLSRVRNRAANKCLDGNDHKTPILYPCYSNENDNQEWTDPTSGGGSIKNARARMCLDYNPMAERQVSVSKNCHTGAAWTVFEPTETTEMRIYNGIKAKESAPIHG